MHGIDSKFEIFPESPSLELRNPRFAEQGSGDWFDIRLRARAGSRTIAKNFCSMSYFGVVGLRLPQNRTSPELTSMSACGSKAHIQVRARRALSRGVTQLRKARNLSGTGFLGA